MVRRVSWAVALLASVLLVLAGCGSTPPPPPDALGTQLNRPIPAAIAGLPLIDQDGRVTSLAALRGKVVVLADSLTLCQETCPMTTANLVNMARATQAAGQGDDVVFVTATVDPERDTPQRLAAYRRLFAPAPANWSTVTANPQTVATLWHYFGVYYARTPEDSPPGTDWLTGAPLTYDVAHADLIFFFDRGGHLRYGIDAAPNTQGHAPPGPLNSFLNDEGRKNLHHPATDAWTPAQGLSVVAWLTGRTIPQRQPIAVSPAPGLALRMS